MRPPAPNRIHQTLARYARAGMSLNCTMVNVTPAGRNQVQVVPLVLPALQRYPPPPLPPRASTPSSALSAPHDWEIIEGIKTTIRSHAKRHLRARPPHPGAIVYPEDRWRRRFYTEHPMELLRLRTLEEDVQTFAGPWTSVRPKGCYELNGENVLQHQQWLMHIQGLQPDEAYAKAVREFHILRAREDTARRLMVDSIWARGRPVKIESVIDKQLRDEDVALARGAEAITRRIDLRRGRTSGNR